jgi:hypothetical protein
MALKMAAKMATTTAILEVATNRQVLEGLVVNHLCGDSQ